jgi:hypothetical protein
MENNPFCGLTPEVSPEAKNSAISEVKPPFLTRPKPRLRRITLRVTVPCFEYRTAKQAAKSLADGGLAEVLAAFVSDWATAEERPGSWEADRVNAWLASHPWEKKEREREAWRLAHQAGKGGA